MHPQCLRNILVFHQLQWSLNHILCISDSAHIRPGTGILRWIWSWVGDQVTGRVSPAHSIWTSLCGYRKHRSSGRTDEECCELKHCKEYTCRVSALFEIVKVFEIFGDCLKALVSLAFLKVFPNRLCQHLRVGAGLSWPQVIAPNGRKDLSWKTACYAKVSMMQHTARSSCLGNDWCPTGNLEIDVARRSFACTLLTAKE